MSTCTYLAKQLRDVHFGNNWTCSSYREHLIDLSWQDAIRSMNDINSIAVLTFHSSYFVDVLHQVLQGKTLDANDKHSFEVPTIQCQEDWDRFLNEVLNRAEITACLIEQQDDQILDAQFFAEKYGNYFRNISGIIEHLHYHLGQIVLIKKMIQLVDKIER